MQRNKRQPRKLTGLAAQLAIMKAICRAIERDKPQTRIKCKPGEAWREY
jgi:hypothetical protein